MSLSYFADTETPSRWEKLMIKDSKLATSTQTPGQLETMLFLLSSPLTHQENVQELVTSSLNNYYKTSYHFPHGNTWF